jgi:hypothetical protein
MTELFDRDAVLQVGSTEIKSRLDSGKVQPLLRFDFDITKASESSPNTAKITLYNLSETNRKSIQKKQFVQLEAGYTNALELLYSGDITIAKSYREEVDWVTEIECGDGGVQYASSRINKSFGKGTSIKNVMKEAFKTLGVDVGNVLNKIDTTTLRKNASQYTNGVVLSGKTSKIVDELMTAAGLQWSIQDGAGLALKPEETTEDPIIELNRSSGLIGSPEFGEDGIINVRSLLRGSIKPGRRIKISAGAIDGFFKVQQVRHVGDTWGNDWYTDIEAKEIQ